MKLTKIFGIVLSLHVAVILLVMFQPGCQTYPGKGEGEGSAPEQPDGNNSSAGFNAGLEGNPTTDPPKVADGQRFPPTPLKPGEVLVPTEPGAAESPTKLRPTDVTVYKVQKGDSLWEIAQRHNLTVDRLLSVNEISKNATLNIGQEIFLPVAGSPKLVPVSTGAEVHVVQSGDTLSGIARTYGVSVSAIQDANNLRSTIIQIGQRLLVPGTVTTRPDPVTKPLVVPGQVTHTVKVGETLTGIASTYGMTPQLLADMNSIEDPRDLQAGQVLIVNPVPITEEPKPAAGESGDDPDDLEAIFKNAGEAPVIPLPPKNE